MPGRPSARLPKFILDCKRQAAEGKADEINTCIACNQACLDLTFQGKRASCLVNPLVKSAKALPRAASRCLALSRAATPSPPRQLLQTLRACSAVPL